MKIKSSWDYINEGLKKGNVYIDITRRNPVSFDRTPTIIVRMTVGSKYLNYLFTLREEVPGKFNLEIGMDFDVYKRKIGGKARSLIAYRPNRTSVDHIHEAWGYAKEWLKDPNNWDMYFGKRGIDIPTKRVKIYKVIVHLTKEMNDNKRAWLWYYRFLREFIDGNGTVSKHFLRKRLSRDIEAFFNNPLTVKKNKK